MKVQRRCSPDQEDGSSAARTQRRSGGWRSAVVAPRGTLSHGPFTRPAHGDRGAVGRPVDGGVGSDSGSAAQMRGCVVLSVCKCPSRGG
jgi:hypothetical protein